MILKIEYKGYISYILHNLIIDRKLIKYKISFERKKIFYPGFIRLAKGGSCLNEDV
jgi:hypothetical protein